MEKHHVTLTDKERRKLVAIVTKGRNKASYIQRAYILLKSADGKTDAEISQWLYIIEVTQLREGHTWDAPSKAEPLHEECRACC